MRQKRDKISTQVAVRGGGGGGGGRQGAHRLRPVQRGRRASEVLLRAVEGAINGVFGLVGGHLVYIEWSAEVNVE